MMRDLTLLMTARWAINSMILNQMPMFSALSATARRVSQTNFWASSLISTQLLMRAKRGARGKAATKIVMKPNWSTREIKIISELITLTTYNDKCLPISRYSWKSPSFSGSRKSSRTWLPFTSPNFALMKKMKISFNYNENLPSSSVAKPWSLGWELPWHCWWSVFLL